jgi:hypothetical protein
MSSKILPNIPHQQIIVSLQISSKMLVKVKYRMRMNKKYFHYLMIVESMGISYLEIKYQRLRI